MNEATRLKYLKFALQLFRAIPALFLVAIVLWFPMPRSTAART